MTLVINKGFNSALAKKQRFIRTVYDKNFLDKNTGIIKEPQDEKCKFIKSGIAIVILGCSIIYLENGSVKSLSLHSADSYCGYNHAE